MRPLRLEELAGKRPRKKGSDEAERLFALHLQAYGLPTPSRQLLFAQELGRQWRWDFAWKVWKVALEIQGGIWIRGAHAHPEDILRNMTKHNDAALLGWRWFQFTPEQVKSGVAALFMQKFFLSDQGGVPPCDPLPQAAGTPSSAPATASAAQPTTVPGKRRSKRWPSPPKARR